MSQPCILVIERDLSKGARLAKLLLREGYAVTRAPDAVEALPLVAKLRARVMLLGPSTIDAGDGLRCAREMRLAAPNTPITLVAEKSSEQLVLNALRAGVNEYVQSVSDLDEVLASVRRCLGRPVDTFIPDCTGKLECPESMVGDSAPMQEIRSRLRKVAPTDSNVLITGETGTGKELAAEMVHRNSLRRHKPFVTINCSAIPDSLIESELFGFERGSFTGADRSQSGKLKAADGGTVFLDEIGDMAPYAQSKLLRMIESREIQRIGSGLAVKVDVRIVAATNHDLEALAQQNLFRKDLFFRLAVTSIHLPPLRDRKEDLLLLLDHHIRYFNARFGRAVRRFSDDAVECLLSYSWPGNIRELKNLVEGVFVEMPSDDLEVVELPPPFRRRCLEISSAPQSERQILFRALLSTNWNKSKAASDLRWSRMKLYRKMAQYNIAPR
jgi:DNA-binding NtrC family response regulator